MGMRACGGLSEEVGLGHPATVRPYPESSLTARRPGWPPVIVPVPVIAVVRYVLLWEVFASGRLTDGPSA
jgi:hypothetical protein